jgi:hypothetical protein
MSDDSGTRDAIVRDSKEWAALVLTHNGYANAKLGRALISTDPKIVLGELKDALDALRKSEDYLMRAIVNVERVA